MKRPPYQLCNTYFCFRSASIAAAMSWLTTEISFCASSVTTFSPFSL